VNPADPDILSVLLNGRRTSIGKKNFANAIGGK
jgi:hypothetical protein